MIAEDLPILHEDPWLVAVDKPSGLAVHRGWAHDDVVLTDLLEERYGRDGVHLLGRLDRGTSGVLLVARNGGDVESFREALRAGEGERCYVALVRGVPPDSGLVDYPIPNEPGGPRVEALTSFRLLASRPTEPRTVSLVAAFPQTGRLHQVRRHLRHITHPLIGDANYGRPDLNRALRAAYGLARLALHCPQVRFRHPFSGELLELAAPLPDDLAGPLAKMGFEPKDWAVGSDSPGAIHGEGA
ncbi:MAG: pseudouridylate synthase [Deltaproteobacteria bacterium]|nr:pseudouridylate synthase [Deltaproteobacteria bacterium]